MSLTKDAENKLIKRGLGLLHVHLLMDINHFRDKVLKAEAVRELQQVAKLLRRYNKVKLRKARQ